MEFAQLLQSFYTFLRKRTFLDYLLLLFVINFTSLFKTASFFSEKITSLTERPVFHYLPWTKMLYAASKPYELRLFLLGFSLFAFVFFVFFLISKMDFARRVVPLSIGVQVCLLDIVLTSVIFLPSIWSGPIQHCISDIRWLAVFSYGVLTVGFLACLYFQWLPINLVKRRISNVISIGFLAVLLLFFSIQNLEFMRGEFVLFNEHVDFSGETKLSSGYVDNRGYIEAQLSYPMFKSVGDFIAQSEDTLKARFDGDVALQTWISGVKQTHSGANSFIEINQETFFWQVQNRSFDMHHNQVVTPVSDSIHGKNPSEIHQLYGFFIQFLTKMWFQIHNQISYNLWFQLVYGLYFVFFGLLALSVYVFFRDWQWVFVVVSGTVAAVFFDFYLGYQYLMLGQFPVNPSRHLMDTVVLIGIFLYFKFPERIWSLILLFAMVGCQLFIGDHFGLIMVASLLSVTLVQSIDLKKPSVFFGAFLSASFWYVLYYFNSVSKHPGVKYFLDGYFSFVTPTPVILTILLYFCLVLFFLFLYWRRFGFNSFLFAALFFAQYVTLLTFHFVWHGNTPDLYPIYPAVFILLALVCVLISDYFFVSIIFIRNILFISACCYLLAAVARYMDTKQAYNKNMSFRRIYTWVDPHLKIRTSMPYDSLGNAIALVKKYSKANPGVWYISKYDSILPVFTDTYSMLPYPNLPYFLMVEEDVAYVSAYIEKHKPEYLFVDTGSDLKSQLWTVNNYFTLSDHRILIENRYRLLRLKSLYDVFENVRHNYRLIESSPLISVYQRIR